MSSIDLTSPSTVWLVLTVLKATLLLLAVVGLAVAFRRASAAVRHLVWSVGIVGVLALPLLTLVIPWQFPVVSITVPPATAGTVAPTPAAPAGDLLEPAAPVEPGPPASSATTTLSEGSPSPPPVRGTLSVLGIAAVAWAVIALMILARLAVGAAVLRRTVRRAQPLETPDWKHPLVEAADRLGLSRLPRLLVSDRLPMPYACGLLRPTIVLPTAAEEWDEIRRRAVLFHELAHVRRFDLLLNTLGHLACALWWFHPLVWLASRRLQVEGERASDDLVLGVGTRASEYADHLLHIVCNAARIRAPAVALPMAQRHAFEGRLLALLERGARREPLSRPFATAIATSALVVLVPLAAAGAATTSDRPGDDLTSGDAVATVATASLTAGPGEAERPADPHPGTGAPAEGGVAAEEAGATPPAPDEADGEAEPAPDPSILAALVAAEAIQDTTHSAAVMAALVRALDDSVATVRREAAYALGQRQAQGAAGPLGVRLAEDPAPTVRVIAAWALGQIESRAATEPLTTALAGDASDGVREMAAWALGQLEDPASANALASAVEGDRSSGVRETAAWALAQIGTPAAPSALITALRDPVAEVRMTAGWALGQIADPAATDDLAAALGDTEVSVRQAVLWALAQMPGHAASPALLRALEDPNADIRAAAARALAGEAGPWPRPRPRPFPG